MMETQRQVKSGKSHERGEFINEINVAKPSEQECPLER